MFGFCMLAWGLFRANSLSEALYIYSHIFSGFSIHLGINKLIGPNKFMLVIFFASIPAIYDFISMRHDVINFISSRKPLQRWVLYNILIVAMFFIYINFAVTNATFVYFQF